MSGVTVATTIRSMAEASTPACSRAAVAAGSARSESASLGAATRRSRIPVRSRIHSSEVSTIFAISSFVITRSGTCDPMPVIETWPFDVALPITPAPRRTSTFRARRAAPSTLASARPLPIGPRTRSRSHVSSSSSPGSTIRLKRTPSMPAKSASRPAVLLGAQHGDRARLRHRLDDQDAGHDRAPGKVTREVPLVGANGLPGDDALAGLELGHLVDQEERVAVREDLFDLRAAERGLGRHGRPSVVGRCASSLRPDSVVPRLRGRFGHPYVYAEVCPSTQRMLTDEHSEGAVALTEEQTEGRGRLGRSWHSPPG